MITGFHAHVYFDEATRTEAERVRESVAQFPVELGKWHEAPIGPHAKPMYQVAFTPEQFASVVTWLMLHREGLSVLVHPRTGDEIADHTTNPLWLGDPLPINLDVIRAHLARS